MTAAGEAPACQPVRGDFHGLPTVGLASASLWFEALATAGPRIVRLGLRGGPNLLAETPDVAWSTARGPYRLHGGHRLWLAPESAGLQGTPDDQGLRVARDGDAGIRLDGAPEPVSGLVRTIALQPDPTLPILRVEHEVASTGPLAVRIALWAITQLPPGGLVLLPQAIPEAGHATEPNRLLALWPYSSAEDPRCQLRDGYIAVTGDPGPDLKLGCSVQAGWSAWAHDGMALVRRWTPQPELPHPDLGCNAEVFVTDRYTELEILGPMVVLAPGERATLFETWELRAIGEANPASLRAALDLPIALDD